MRDIIQKYFEKLLASIREDADGKGQKMPSLRIEADENGGKLIGPHYFKYLVYGRGPGKRPPREAMLDFVRANPEILASAKQRFKYITEKGLAYIIGRKIGAEGTDIYQGKKPGIDLLGAMEEHIDELLRTIARNEALAIRTSLKTKL